MSDKLLTHADYEELMTRQRRADESEQRRRILHGMEIRLVEIVGTNGDGGKFGVLEERVDRVEARSDKFVERLEKTEEFMNKAKWTLILIAGSGGVIAALAEVALKHFL